MPLYAWGSNGSGQLGIGHKDDVCIPTLCTEVTGCDNDPPKAITAGGNHTLILHGSGRVSEIGLLSGVNKHHIQTEVKLISATWDASFVCHSGEQGLVSFGSGNRPELGRGRKEEQQLGFGTMIHDGNISDMASGVHHTVMVISETGKVLGWGNGRKGQLGEPVDVIWEPRIIENVGFKVKRAVCGQTFTFLAGDPDEGRCLVLGQDKFGIRSDCPSSIVGWKDIGASWGSIFVLFEDGRLISWGRNDHGQLAPANLPNVTKIAVGSEHALALCENGTLYAWGWGEHGNCGSDIDEAGDVKESVKIVKPDGIGHIQGIGAGCATSWFWT